MRVGLAALGFLAIAGCRPAGLDPRLGGEPVHAEIAPPPISGGTIAVSADRGMAIVADPDRDRIVLVDLATDSVHAVLELPAGSEPGRVALAGGRAHVALRGTGEVASFALVGGDIERRAVCAMPRGLAYDASRDALIVVCRGGEIVTLPAAGGAPISSVRFAERDLRDVLVVGDRVFVTTFRAAHIYEIDRTTGAVLAGARPRSAALDLGTFEPAVAWRTIAVPGTSTIAMVHQRGLGTSIVVADGAAGAYGAPSEDEEAPACASGAVHTAITIFTTDLAISGGAVVPHAALPVDVASLDGEIAIVAAGNQGGSRAVLRIGEPERNLDPAMHRGCAQVWERAAVAATSVAYDGVGLLIFERDPAVLVRDHARIALGGRGAFDTGHAIFHGDAGGDIACASCHPEGGDDGRSWVFDGAARRTQALHPMLTATAPFHWDGAHRDLGSLMHDVFTGRMRGPALRADQVVVLGRWLDAMPAAHRSTPADAEAVARGREIFEGTGGCASCHAGEQLTNGESMDVGTGGVFQVPSLVGVSDRLPVMRSGCAATLADRFASWCGGDSHGSSALSQAEVADVVSFLETL